MSQDQTTTLEARTGTVSAGTLRVEVVAGPSVGATTMFDSDAITVGSAGRNALSVADPLVSRIHLELVRTDDAIRVTDLGSTNGTFLGSARVVQAFVQPGAIVRIGSTELRITAGRAMSIDLADGDSLPGMLGGSQVMRRLMATIQRVAPGSSSVLITGESGTGKEAAANALHALGPRAHAPFVTVDCGSLAASLVASELFGHDKGAFTGADRQHAGAFERAHGGTLFLDEIGELGLDTQAALLGVLERRRFRRVGGRADISVDVRLVAATHRDLRAEVNHGRFRLDLYYRLAVVELVVPPLRERLDDLPRLIEHFLGELGSARTALELFGADGLAALADQRWPGNVRELRNAVEAALVLGGPAAARSMLAAPAGDLDEALDQPYKLARAAVTSEFERRYLIRLLARADDNVSKAARMSQMDRSHLIELVRKHRLRGGG